jgi:hypothetical protein
MRYRLDQHMRYLSGLNLVVFRLASVVDGHSAYLALRARQLKRRYRLNPRVSAWRVAIFVNETCGDRYSL